MSNQQSMVSVVMITYGHEKYIEEAINGVYMQQTDFAVELIIANDCSPDNTDEVVKNLIANAPENITIKYTLHEQNLGMMPNFMWALEQAGGKYIALCEGDDYWTDPLKLQKQVDFLEGKESYSLTFSNANILRETEQNKIVEERDLVILNNSRQFSDIEILEDWIIPTASVLFRNFENWKEIENILIDKRFIFGDIVLFLYLSKKGKIWGMSDYLVTYRRQPNGATQVENHFTHNIKYRTHLKTLIEYFGVHLRTKKIKCILSNSSMYTGLDLLKRGKICKGGNNLASSVFSDYRTLLMYIKKKKLF